MKRHIEYMTIDGRGEHENFKDCVTQALKKLEPGQGLHLIKDFEPFPLYRMMESKGFSKKIEKVSETEYHAYFYKNPIDMEEYLTVDSKRMEKIVNIKVDYLLGKIDLETGRHQLSGLKPVTSQEFALAEQYLKDYGISDDTLAERIEEIMTLFDGFLEHDELDLEEGHPVHTYRLEVSAIRKLLVAIKSQMTKKFIKNQWLELYDQLDEINVHFARKQNQIYPALESKGFDKPSKVMWTLENDIKTQIKTGRQMMEEDEKAFMAMQHEVIEMIEDMMVKEEEILYPTVVSMLTREEFVKMRQGDDEIGYCLIDTPKPFGGNSSLEQDLANVLKKHGILTGPSGDVLDVSQGQLTLEQINLIFKHLTVDLSFVDEDELVKFYSDTKHRVFPRSPGVIGRKVQNCHPRESVHMVEEIIRAFKAGEQDEAEFWLEINGKFIYIVYTAVRDTEGQYRGILEMMQDVTKIRGLEGDQRLLSWTRSDINGDTKVGELIKSYPYLKEVFISLSPKFKKLNNPVLFKTMASAVTLDMICQRGQLKLKDVINTLDDAIKKHV